MHEKVLKVYKLYHVELEISYFDHLFFLTQLGLDSEQFIQKYIF